MGISCHYPLMLILLPLVFYPVYLWYRDSSHLASGRRIFITVMRIILLLSLVLALSGLEIRFPLKNQSVVFVVDLSASCEQGQERVENFIQEAWGHKGPDDKAGVVVFGGNARVEQTLSGTPSLESIESLVDRDYSDVETGLRVAAAMLPQDAQKRVVLWSDGRQNSGDGLAEVRRLVERGVRVDVLPFQLSEGPEVRVDSLSVPQKLFADERFEIKVRVNSNVSTPTLLRIYQDHALLVEERAQVVPGDNVFVYTSSVSDTGFHTFRAVAEPTRDTIPENNEVSAFTFVHGPPTVLLVEGQSGEARAIHTALDSMDVQVEVTTPEVMPATLTGLNRFATVVLCNVPAEKLRGGTMEALHAAVRDLGMGLVMVGGDQSFGPGGYFKTPVEKALPVNMDLRGKAEIPSLGLVLVIDKSSSMSGMAGGYTKMDLAREAAVQATEVLGPLDRIGVVAFDNSAQWVVKMRAVDDLEAIQDEIGTIRASGGTNIFPALQLAYEDLKDARTKYKHVILLTDGQSATAGDYYFLARRMEKEGITMSSVAVGDDADTQLLQMLAEWGRGRYYFTNESASIPRIFTKETMMALRQYFVEETFAPQMVTSPLLQGISGLPVLHGYVAVSPKKAAQVALVSHQGDPVLAGWQYGLGRTVAFTSDAGGRWAGSWVAWPGYNQWWGNIISWTLPRGMENAFNLDTFIQGETGFIKVDSADLTAAAVTTTATVVTPSLERRVVELEPTAPGRFEGSFSVREPGVYLMNITQRQQGQIVGTVNGGTALSYSPEYSRVGTDLGFLQQLVSAGGGSILSSPEEAFADNLPPVRGSLELWPWLLILAALSLPLDIAARRLNLTGSGLRTGWNRIRGQMKKEEEETGAASTLTRLRARKDQVSGSGSREESAVESVVFPVKPEPKPSVKAPKSRREREKTVTGQKEGKTLHTSRLLEAKKRLKR
ncbi:MAG: VWA domain-containing protein [Syntrophomonadaceae bacterium]|nr:VWA domain-containing protein [Syntrophomonadaceae bacterium]